LGRRGVNSNRKKDNPESSGNNAAVGIKLVTKLQRDFGLGRGEAEAIVLALAEKVQVLRSADALPRGMPRTA
jgi:predicted nucleic acid-binding protein